jgi:hypothetical protein
MSLLQNVRDYTPSRAALGWTAGGASVLTVVVGFALLGWTTGGAAERMAAEARTGAQTELAAAVCAANFRTLPTAQETHAELVGLSGMRQRQFVQDQAWAQVPGLNGVSRATAELCARLIADMDPEELDGVAAT